ncbi:MAG TPA: hypothetical protein VN727_08715 [Candidatus Binatia bacterium]|jgi:hypothetical protein|nr:hypothetical protein [Candidatus Binatia bacterium]
MDREVARTLINQELRRLKESPYRELLKLLDKTSTTMLEGPDGVTYQMETQAFWDSKAGGNIRVMVSVDDGRFFSAVKPLTGDFIISPDGSFL